MKLNTFSIFCVFVLLVGLSGVPRPAPQEIPGQAFSAVPLRPQVAAALRAQGKPSPEMRFPNSVNRGRPFNPRDAYPVGSLVTPDELKALVILVQFSDTTYTYDQPTFQDLILGSYYNPPGNSVTLPDGQVEKFQSVLTPSSQWGSPIESRYRAENGGHGSPGRN